MYIVGQTVEGYYFKAICYFSLYLALITPCFDFREKSSHNKISKCSQELFHSAFTNTQSKAFSFCCDTQFQHTKKMSLWNNSNCLTMLLNYIQFIWSQINTPYFLLVLFSRAWIFKWLPSLVQNRNRSYCCKWKLFSWQNTFSKGSDKKKEKKKKKGSRTHVASHPPKKVYSLQIIQAHTSVWISHYYPKLFF